LDTVSTVIEAKSSPGFEGRPG